MKIAVSAGHYPPKDLGCTKDNVVEYFKNCEVANSLQEILYHKGHTIYNPTGSIKSKVDKINTFYKPDIAIEIHHNANKDKKIRGAEIIYHPTSARGEFLSYCIAETIHANGYDSRGIFEGYYRYDKSKGYYYFTSHTRCLALIIECAYMTNADDLKLMLEKDYAFWMSSSIYEGIDKYI